MIRLSELNLLPGERDLRRRAAKLLHLHEGDILDLKIVRRAVDARKKPQVRLVYTVDVAVKGDEEAILNRCPKAKKAPEDRYCPPEARPAGEKRPVVIGFGPAGMFAGLILALAGQKPIILERGEDARTRQKKVQKFWEAGELDPDSNVQFGEGGAGTFSDGKLNTGVNNPRIQWVLEQFVAAGAKEDILYDAKPHVGTDILLTVVRNLRHRIEDLGGEVRFHAQVTGLDRENGALTGLRLSDGSSIPCDRAILAIGHSARDTVTMLHELGLPMEPKPFAMGVRIEQNQKVINKAQYGGLDPKLPAADYKLVAHLQDRTVYTFCMCPGGYVVAAASEAGGVVTNGMSYSGRKGENANAALLVSLNPTDFPGTDPLSGMRWQREIEEKAFAAGGENYHAPAQRVADFQAHRPSTTPGSVQPTYRPGVTWTDLHEVLPKVLTDALEEALPVLEKRLPGFAPADAVLTAPESRSSSPVRLLRDETRQSALRGLYPAGEGAGYAGGIMSAAVDGILSAEALLESL